MDYSQVISKVKMYESKQMSSDIIRVLTRTKNWAALMSYLFGENFTLQQFHSTVEGMFVQTLSAIGTGEGRFPLAHMQDLTDITVHDFTLPKLPDSRTVNSVIQSALNEIGVLEIPTVHVFFGRSGAASICNVEDNYDVTRLAFIKFDHTPKGYTCRLTVSSQGEKLGIKKAALQKYFAKHKARTKTIEVGRLSASPKGTLNINRFQISDKIRLDKELYPNLPVSPAALLNQFLASESTSMYLVGSAGSGKSTLVRALARKQEVILVDDYRLMSSEYSSTLGTYILEATENTVIVFEEIESHLSPRDDGNQSAFIKTLLQVTSGVVKTKAKIVICANSKDTSQYDQALLRSDRCFGAFVFKDLTAEQANAAATVLNKPAVYEKSVCLSDIFNGGVVVKKRQFGFTPN